jgi:tetratricopeptide (TPR) repeat protein
MLIRLDVADGVKSTVLKVRRSLPVYLDNRTSSGSAATSQKCHEETSQALRKLGDYKVSQIWYERALKADPNHVKTWQYYGLWQVEQGNRDQAQYHLSRIAALAGTNSEEYRSLAAALEKPPGTGLVY